MFYESISDNFSNFRFGDVLKGYIEAIPHIEEPTLSPVDQNYQIDIGFPKFSVIISPCCSIGNKIISLTPLIQLRGDFFGNPYFAEDLTRINRKMEPSQTVSPEIWAKFSLEEKEKRLKEGNSYALLELFIYEKNDFFPKYVVDRKQGNIETNFYMIDFRNTYKLCCEKIVNPKDVPIVSKVLQLSIATRSELRDKLSSYYGKTPKEDKIQED